MPYGFKMQQQTDIGYQGHNLVITDGDQRWARTTSLDLNVFLRDIDHGHPQAIVQVMANL
jgi:hypothetical protein